MENSFIYMFLYVMHISIFINYTFLIVDKIAHFLNRYVGLLSFQMLRGSPA
jgi:hypothetical protein